MSDLWTEATFDAEAEEMDRLVTSARIAAVDLWPFLAAAETEVDFGNRKAMVTDRLDAIVSSLLPSNPVAFSVVRASVESGFDEDFAVVAQGRRAEALVRARQANLKRHADKARKTAEVGKGYCTSLNGVCPCEQFIPQEVKWESDNGPLCKNCEHTVVAHSGGPLSDSYVKGSRKTAKDDGQQCPSCKQYEAHWESTGEKDEDGEDVSALYCSNCDYGVDKVEGSRKTASTASPEEGSIKSEQTGRGDMYKRATCKNCGGGLRRKDQFSSGWTHASTNTKNCPDKKTATRKTAAEQPIPDGCGARDFSVEQTLAQIGRMNILSISGGRVNPITKGSKVVGISLPVAQGYCANVFLHDSDTYIVQRTFRGTVKGEQRNVYMDEVGEVVYRAGMYHHDWGGHIKSGSRRTAADKASLEAGADAAYDREDQSWFDNLPTEDLVYLWSLCTNIETMPSYDDEVYDALYARGHFAEGSRRTAAGDTICPYCDFTGSHDEVGKHIDDAGAKHQENGSVTDQLNDKINRGGSRRATRKVAERQVDLDAETGEFVGSEWEPSPEDPNTLVQSETTFGKNPRFKSQEEGDAWVGETGEDEAEPKDTTKAEVAPVEQPAKGDSKVPDQFKKKTTRSRSPFGSRTSSKEGDSCSVCGKTLTSSEIERLNEDIDFIEHDGHTIRVETTRKIATFYCTTCDVYVGDGNRDTHSKDSCNVEQRKSKESSRRGNLFEGSRHQTLMVRIYHGLNETNRAKFAAMPLPQAQALALKIAAQVSKTAETSREDRNNPDSPDFNDFDPNTWREDNFESPKTRTVDGVRVHEFSSTAQAYNESQVSDDIKDGDVLIVPSEGVYGFLNEAWPIAVVGQGEFHTVKAGMNPAEIAGGRYAKSVQVALRLSGKTASRKRAENANPYTDSGNPYVAPTQEPPGTPDDVLDGPGTPIMPITEPMTTRPRQIPGEGTDTDTEDTRPTARRTRR